MPDNEAVFSLFDFSSDLVFFLDSKGEVTYSNQTALKKLGWERSEVLGKPFIELVKKDQLDMVREQLAALQPDHTSTARFQTVMVSKYEKQIYLNGHLSVDVGRDAVHYRLLCYDVTERIRTEKAQALYYRIASLATKKSNADTIYNQIYEQLTAIFRIRNFNIALKKELGWHYVYSVHEGPDSHRSRDVENLLSAYTIALNQPVIIYKEGIRKIADQKKRTLMDALPEIWLGVIIHLNNQPAGVLSIFSYHDQSAYNNRDLELLDFLAGQIGLSMGRQYSEQKIQDQAARLHAIFESSTHQIWSVNRAYELTSFNLNYSEDFYLHHGMYPELGTPKATAFGQYLSSTERDSWRAQYDKCFEGATLNFQCQLTSRTGKITWHEVFMNPIQLAEGPVQEISVISNDITEKKTAEDALRTSEGKFRNIFESFQDIYFRCTTKGRVTMISPSCARVLGFHPNELMDKVITQYLDMGQQMDELLRSLKTEGSLSNLEGKATTRAGDPLTLLFNLRLIITEHGQTEMEGVARDITKLNEAHQATKKAQEIAEHSLKVKEQFLANMSHEIRTPMNGIIGMIDLLGLTELDEEQAEYLQTIRQSSKTLMDIVNDILDLSKIEAGKMDLKLAPVHLVKAFEKVYDLYSQPAHLRNNAFYYHLDPHLPAWILADETRLIQVLSNLTSNAVKFSRDKGTINLSIRVEEKVDHQYLFKVSIKDSGIGIAPKDQERLFKNFQQLDASSRKNYEGTGLGLVISKELVQAMGGEIGVVSTPGLGSTFWFTFRADATDTPAQEPQKEPHMGTFRVEHPKVLVVDDNQVNRNVASKILTKAGCRVLEAANGDEAISHAIQSNFDLIFMDVQMPGKDGVETMMKIKNLVGIKQPPIVAMTAYSMEDDMSRFLSQGMDDYLPKPIKAFSLIEMVRKWTRFQPEAIAPDEFQDTGQQLVINQNTLNQLRKYGGGELIRASLRDFEADTKELLKSIKKHLRKASIEDLQMALHTLKGNSGTLGIEKIASLAAAMEKKTKAHNFEGLEVDMASLITYFKEFQESCQNILSTNEQTDIAG